MKFYSKKGNKFNEVKLFYEGKTTSCVCCFNILKSFSALCPHFSVCFSILITSLGEEGAGLCASRTFVCFARVCFCPFSLPLIEGWLRFVIVAYLDLSINFFL